MSSAQLEQRPTLQMEDMAHSKKISMDLNSMDNSAFEGDDMMADVQLQDGHVKSTEPEHKPDIVSRIVESFWDAIGKFIKKYKFFISKALLAALGVLYMAYFIQAAIYYDKHKFCNNDVCELEWCNGFGMLVILTVLVVAGLLYFQIIKRFFGKVIYKSAIQPTQASLNKLWKLRFVRLILYSVPVVALIVFLVLDTANDRTRLISFLGLVVLMLLGFVFSRHPGKIQWRPVFWGLALQFIFGLLTIRWDVGRQIFRCIGEKLTTFLAYTNGGSSFVYGDDLINQGIFAFQVLSVIFFLSTIVQILYYWGTMQWVVMKLGWLLQISMGTTVCESVNAAGSIFLGISESPLLIKPYIGDLTHSEMHAVMTAGFATVAGTVLAAYISFGVNAAHILTASIMSAPAALCYSKLFYPETRQSKTKVDNIKVQSGDETNVLDAATKGAIAGIGLVLGITANLIAFISIVNFLDGALIWFSLLVGEEEYTFQLILGKVFIPLVWLMGVESKDCEKVATLVGLKTVVNEFIAYKELGEMIKNNVLSPRAEAIATYALCGFSNPGSIGILVGALTTMAPEKRSVVTEVALRAFVSGSAVCFLTACIAGILFSEENYQNQGGNTTSVLNWTTGL